MNMMRVRDLLARYRTPVAVVLTILLAFSMHWLEFHGVFAGAEGQVANAYLRQAAVTDSVPIITVGIDDDDYRDFFDSTSPLEPAAVIGLVDVLRTSGALVVGVDLLTESSKYEPARARDWPNVVWAAGAEEADVVSPGYFAWVTGRGHEELRATAGHVLGAPVDPGATNWGIAVFPRDHDGTVRRAFRTWVSKWDGLEYENTLANMVAHAFCAGHSERCAQSSGHEVFLRFGASGEGREQGRALRDLVRCTDPADERNPCERWAFIGENTLKGAIVLLGGTFAASRDFYDTPLGGGTSGLMLNASAVQAEIAGLGVAEAGRWVSLGLDMVIGWCIVGIFSIHPFALRRSIAWSVALAIPAFLAGHLLFSWGVLWLGWIGMILSGLTLHVVLEVFSHGEAHPGTGHIRGARNHGSVASAD
jgi:CHASE2 domain-containing sensor protein